MADINKTVNIVFRGADEVSAASARVRDAVQRVADESNGAAVAFDKFGNAKVKASVALGELKKDAAAAADETKRLGDTTETSSAKTEKFAIAMRALATSMVVKAFLDSNVAAERFVAGMTQVTGSSEAARKELDYVSDTADRLGVRVGSLADAYLSFSAATQGTRFEGEATRAMFEAVAGTMASLGRSSSETASVLVQLTQGISKGKLEMQDLKSIANAMPGFFSNFADSLGITTAKLQEMISKGEIGGDQFLIFASKINAGMDGVRFDGFEQNLERLRNSIDRLFTDVGNAGAMDVMTAAIKAANAVLTGFVSTAVLAGETVGNLWGLMLNPGSWSTFKEAMSDALDRAAERTSRATAAFDDLGDAAQKAGGAAKSSFDPLNESAAETAQLLRQSTTTSDGLAASLKTLGIKPEQIKQPLSEIITAFENLAANPAANGGQILAGLRSALKSSETIDDIERLSGALTKAFVNGRLSADEFGQASVLLGERQDKVSAALGRAGGAAKSQADALRQQAKETERAEQAAKQYALELEKLASNERIKMIEARVQLNVAQVQADTERIKAAFESIDSVIDSTGDVIGSALGALKDVVPYTDNFRLIQDQLEKENELRREAFTLQKQLTEAQIEHLRAQTEAMLKGEALIKIDGANLQPHLEAFMWEILRTIQTRVNRDGLAMLLGGF